MPTKLKLNQNSQNQDLQGEGNYTAAKKYDDDTRNFIASGKVKKAVENAAPKDAGEREMQEAEAIGRSRAKGQQVRVGKAVPSKKGDSNSKPYPKAGNA